MNYYPHHIGDYAKDTAHLTMLEDGAYRRMMDLYYASESPLPEDRPKLYRLLRARDKAEKSAVDTILAEYFTLRSDGFHKARCDAEISKAKEKSAKAAQSAGKRWQSEGNANASANAMRTHSEGNAPNNQEPIANNQGKTKTAGAVAPRSDPAKEEIWKTGRAILQSQGASTESAGSFLGKLCREYGQILVLEAVRDCEAASPAEAKAWLTARCQERRALSANKQASLEARNAAAGERWLRGGNA